MLDELWLDQEIRKGEEELALKQVARRDLDQGIAQLSHELRLLRELAELRTGRNPLVPAPGEPTLVADEELRTAAEDGRRDDLVAGAIAILRSEMAPMHVQHLMHQLRQGGYVIPGRGDAANLIAHIRRSPAIVRPVRGMYGLREWGLEDRTPSARPAPKRTKRRAKRRTGVKPGKPAGNG